MSDQGKQQYPDPMSDEAADAALWYLRNNADAAGKAKADVVYMENFLKIVLARCMRDSTAQSVAAQEVSARCNPEYLKTLEALQEAISREEEFRWKRIAAEATIEAWRSRSANQRGERKMQ